MTGKAGSLQGRREGRMGESSKRRPLAHALCTGMVAALSLGISCAKRSHSLPIETRYSVPERSQTVLTRVAFGSCNDVHRDQPLWEPLVASQPGLFIWTGDIVYADRIQLLSYGAVQLYVPLPQLRDPTALRDAYAFQRLHPGYARLLKRTPVIGVYDDHDFGKNNGGAEYPHKKATGRLLLDFLNVPANSPRRTRAGVYGTYVFGPAGQRVRVILLDPRFHRGHPGAQSPVLGEAQEAWLQKTLAESDADVHLLVSGFQVLPQDHPYETWAKFPAARRRLFSVLGRTRPKGLLIITGDRHQAEYSELRLPSGFTLREITSSGLTHVYDHRGPEPNRHRRGALIRKLNFGLLTLDWQRRVLHVEVHGVGGAKYLSQAVPL